ncbi:MAG: PilZ domain-containing protein [Deltaproteobacteria bacterium]|nr:PilZ domain-containing protein [Deltaproteobacteria bacterium]
MSDIRRAPRLVVNAPAVIESIGQGSMQLHPNLAKVFRRVDADRSSIGSKFPAVVRDLSTNGAFISGAPLPLLSRVALKFEVKGLGTVDAIGWVLWQRMDDCELPGQAAAQTLPKGFGVLFEAIPMETRTAIAALVARHAGT